MTGYIYDPELPDKQNKNLINDAQSQLDDYVKTLGSNIKIKMDITCWYSLFHIDRAGKLQRLEE